MDVFRGDRREVGRAMKTESLSATRKVSALRTRPNVGVDERQARRECVHVTNLKVEFCLVYGYIEVCGHVESST